MGTESKFNCYSKNTTSTDKDRIPKINDYINGVTQNECTDVHAIDETSELKFASNSTSSSVPSIPIYVDQNNVIDGAKEILKYIRPQWNLNAVQFKKFTDGITNKLVGCFYDQTANTNSDNGSENSNFNVNHTSILPKGSAKSSSSSDGAVHDDDGEKEKDSCTKSPENSVVLVRVYGNNTDLLIDRKAELRNILLMNSHGFAPAMYATFKNGLAYDYVPGVTLNRENVLLPEVWRLVACRMAEMHYVLRVDNEQCCSDVSPVPMLWKKTQSFFDLVPERFSDANKHKRLEGTFLPISRLRDEFTSLYRHLETLGSPLVFAHNDLLLGNIVYTESLKRVSFIDFEYADYNFQAFDIGNHFAEFAGVDDVDYTRYPNREFQLQWLRVYMEAYLRRNDISDDEVNRLYVQVNQFSLAAHLFWTIWSLIQAEHSKIDFDYVGYAFLRYNEYLSKKDEFMALQIDILTS